MKIIFFSYSLFFINLTITLVFQYFIAIALLAVAAQAIPIELGHYGHGALLHAAPVIAHAPVLAHAHAEPVVSNTYSHSLIPHNIALNMSPNRSNILLIDYFKGPLTNLLKCLSKGLLTDYGQAVHRSFNLLLNRLLERSLSQPFNKNLNSF